MDVYDCFNKNENKGFPHIVYLRNVHLQSTFNVDHKTILVRLLVITLCMCRYNMPLSSPMVFKNTILQHHTT